MLHRDGLEVVFVEIGVHPDALLPLGLVIFRAGQGCQDEQLENVERQFLLDDLHVAQDGFARVAGETQNVAGVGQRADAVPRLEHCAILRDAILALARVLQ